jgi:hypothetical protein
MLHPDDPPGPEGVHAGQQSEQGLMEFFLGPQPLGQGFPLAPHVGLRRFDGGFRFPGTGLLQAKNVRREPSDCVPLLRPPVRAKMHRPPFEVEPEQLVLLLVKKWFERRQDQGGVGRRQHLHGDLGL